MSKNNSEVWTTKYGPRRVRHEAPTLDEAIIAAQSLTDDPTEQTSIAASLMGLSDDQVRAELLKTAPPRKNVAKSFAFVGSPAALRTVVVERKPSRRGVSAANRSVPKRTDEVSSSERSSRATLRRSS